MGLGLLWKPRGLLSQRCLLEFKNNELQIERVSGKSQIGHTGTLDPFAEGLLLVAWQEGTKLLHPLNGLDKTYRVGMRFGATSDTLDATGKMEDAPSELLSKIKNLAVASWSEKGFFESFLASKVGVFEQVPPAFSAVHVDGKRAYDLARQGIRPELKARKAEILGARHLSFDINQLEWTFEVKVSSGTYIRSLARDWGQELSSFPGYLNTLIRTQIGIFEWKGSIPQDPSKIEFKLLNLQDVAPYFGVTQVSTSEAGQLVNIGRLSRAFGDELKPTLLTDPEGIVIAWIEKDTGKIGRIFRADPFAKGEALFGNN